MAFASVSAPATFATDVGAALSKAPVASTWKADTAARISLTGGRSTRYRSFSWAVSDSAWDALATPRKAPASAIRVSTTPSRTMARWGAYHLQASGAFVVDSVPTVLRIGAFVPFHKVPELFAPNRVPDRFPGQEARSAEASSLVSQPKGAPGCEDRGHQRDDCRCRGRSHRRPAH